MTIISPSIKIEAFNLLLYNKIKLDCNLILNVSMVFIIIWIIELIIYFMAGIFKYETLFHKLI